MDFPISGQIDPKAFPFLLTELHRSGATGSLKVTGPQYQKALYFRGGRVLFGSSNDPKDQLGSILIESGKITQEQLDDVNTKVGPGKPLAKVLAETGFVNQRELSEAARSKVERILSDVLAYESGGFEFEDGVLPKGAIDLKLHTEKLVVTATRRVKDRNFVLRHLGSLEIVLRSKPEAEARMPEAIAETAGLTAQFDGTRTLKDAIARTRLDEFEGAKLACALLFLAAVDRAGGDEGTLSFADDTSGGELDLGNVASVSFGAEEEKPDPGMETAFFGKLKAPLPIELESARPTAEAPTAPASLPPMPAPAREEGPGTMIGTVAAFRWTPEAEPAPSEPLPETVITKAVPEPPAPEPEPPAPPQPEPAEAPASRKRPSKEDLAALDVLLGSRPAEGPLEPLEKAADWTPQFSTSRRPSRSARSSSGSGSGGPLKATAAVLGLAVLVGGGYLAYDKFGHRSATPRPTPAPATTLAPPPSTEPVGAASPAETAPAPQVPAATTPPAAPPTPTPATTLASKPVPVPAAGGLDGARALLGSGRLDEAAREFAGHLRSTPPGTATVQLLVACSPDTVQKAVRAVGPEQLVVLPIDYRGKACYRLCWGLHESNRQAAAAVGSLPDYFRKGGAAPKVLTAAEAIR